MRLLPALFLLLVPGVLVAQEDASLTLLCRQVEAHEPQENVAYQPGIDIEGRPVTPADLNHSINIFRKPVVIPLTVDLEKRFDLDLPTGVELEPRLGTLTIHPDGRVLYNERDLSVQAHIICGKERKVQEIPPQTPQGNGQAQPDRLNSGEILEGQSP